MNLVAKLPSMEDAALAVLHDNARRLEQSGTKAQKSAATALIPALETELENRREAKLAAAREKRAASKRAAKPRAKSGTGRAKSGTGADQAESSP